MLKWLLAAVAIFAVDQAAKLLVMQHLDLHTAIAIVPGVNFALAYNEGAAFSMLADHSGWQQKLFIGAAVLISIVITGWLRLLPADRRLEGLALTCILGGAAGNLLDRIRFGHVVDFIDVYYGAWHWYTFNIADAFICVGTFLLIWTTIMKSKQ